MALLILLFVQFVTTSFSLPLQRNYYSLQLLLPTKNKAIFASKENPSTRIASFTFISWNQGTDNEEYAHEKKNIIFRGNFD